jgi:hypothetical protein
MKKYEIEIEGITPVVWNRQKMELREIIKGLKKDQLEENELKNWKMKAETNNGNAIIPPEWIIGCLVNSAKETRIIPWFATTKNQTYTKYISNIKISPGIPIVAGKVKDLKRKDAILSSQGKSNRGGKVLRCHPILEKWNAKYEVIDTIGRMKLEELETLFRWGGQAVGIGDQRIFNFGRFDIKSIKEIDINERAKS